MQRVNFIYDAVPAPGSDPDAIRPQASEILELGWFNTDELPATIPDDYEKILLREARAEPGAEVLVTEAIQFDERIDGQ